MIDKEIEIAAAKIAETVFYHFTDTTQKEELKYALIEFAKAILKELK